MQRQIIIIEGELSDSISLAKRQTANLNALVLLDPKQAHQYLGQEFDAVIFNAHDRFDPNAFGAVTGTIRAGGYLILLKPENWSETSLFLKRFDHILSKTQHTLIHTTDENKPLPLPVLPPFKTAGTEDQNNLVSAIIKVVKGHRRRPLIITADRGRGKSAALGIAAAQLYAQGSKNIIVCAPSKKTAAIIFKFTTDKCPLTFYSPDDLQQQKPKADLLLIDEAAAIPLPLLEDFAQHYSRIVFSTTQHGYEGSGRGFTLNFKKSLDKIAPEWREVCLSSPIRWKRNDPLENFVFKALLLNAKAADSQMISTAKPNNCHFCKLNKSTLIQNETQLNEVFGLLVDAHYQTKPSDFLQMLDDDRVNIYTLSRQSHIIAVSLLVAEGNLSKALASDVFAGKRRIKGHLVAQSLAANIGLEKAPCLSGLRIMRIAVHPKLQRHGFGSLLIRSIRKTEQVDYFSTSFGATESLINFWESSHFTPAYLSMKRDASSGTHSLIMLNGQTKKGIKIANKARKYFNQAFPLLLADPFRNLEYQIVLRLIKPSKKLKLSKQQQKIVNAFAHQKRGYENSLYPILKLVLKTITNQNKLEINEKIILVNKVLQKRSWNTITTKIRDNSMGKTLALSILRQAITKLLH